MTLDALIMLVGVLVAVVAFLGFPVSWFGPIFFVLGVIVIGLGILVRRRGVGHSLPPSSRGEFVESAPVRSAREASPDTQE